MSRIVEAALVPTERQTPGNPSSPGPVAPPDYDGHAEGQVIDVDSKGVGQRREPSSLPDDGSADLEDAPVGGLEETRESDDGLGPVNEDEDEPALPEKQRMNSVDLVESAYDQTSGSR